MEFKIGRSNLALTVFVPYDCKNNCSFCTSKESYQRLPASFLAVKNKMLDIFNNYDFPIVDVVFTGGEPMADIDGLKALIAVVPANKNVYINTAFTCRNLVRFIDLVNSCDEIKGVNISRHGCCFGEDSLMLQDIAEDKCLCLINKPVRINCVYQGQDIEKICNRWKNRGVCLEFRKDYRDQPFFSLHNPYDGMTFKLRKLGYTFCGHSQCNVCDTITFEKGGFYVKYHRGLERSSIGNGFELEINDLIIRQDGAFCYDWEGCSPFITDELLRFYNKRNCFDAMAYASLFLGSSCGGGGHC